MPDAIQESFDTRSAYLLALDRILVTASHEICIFDRNLETLDLDGRERSGMLSAFLSGGQNRTLRLVLHDTDHLQRFSPRVMNLLKRYSHSFLVKQSPESLRNLADCFVVADASSGVIRFHGDHMRGKLLLNQPEEIQGWQQRFEDLWLESAVGPSATHLGL